MSANISEATVRELRDQAQKTVELCRRAGADAAAVNGQYARALSLCEQALKLQPDGPTTTKLVHIAALSACNLKNVGKAQMYFRRASPSAKTGIRQTCLRVARFDPGAG